ncbi:MAG: hypothetical protein AMXMBFR12_09280 [Candidatus Babeliales bacterium]
MKFAHVLFLSLSFSLPATSGCYPSYYRPTPKPAKVTYYHTNHCHCYQCNSVYYEYDCPYCYDCYGGCSECDKTAGKLVLIGLIIGIAAYLTDKVLNS